MPKGFRLYGSRRVRGGQSYSNRFKKRSGSSLARRTSSFFKRPAYDAPRYSLSSAYPTITADRTRTTHRYSTIVNLSTTSGVSDPYVFRGNSVYDPDVTSTGYQAVGVSTMALLYSNYLVTGSSITVRALSRTGTVPAMVSVLPTMVGTTVSTSAEDYASNPYAKDTLMTLNGDARTIRSYMSTSKMMGMKLSGGVGQSLYNGNPSAQWYWQIKIDRTNGTAEAYVDLVVDLVYYTEWSSRSAFATRT